MSNRDETRFLGNDENDCITDLAQTNGGAVTRAEILVNIRAGGQRQDAGGGPKPAVSDDDGAVVQRCFIIKNVPQKVGGNFGIQLHAGASHVIEFNMALQNDQRAGVITGHFDIRLTYGINQAVV